MGAMQRPGPLLHLAVIALLVVPAMLLWGHPQEPARAATSGRRQTITLDEWTTSPAAARGRIVYDEYCGGCHGTAGEGDGIAARWLNPLPRNFQKGTFKFRSTPSGQLPTRDDLDHTISCGLTGSAMPGFPLMPSQERRDVVEFVLHLVTYGLARNEVEYLMDEEGVSLDAIRSENLAEIQEEMWAKVATTTTIPVPTAPPSTPELIARGKEIFDAQCIHCHGATGRGDGSSSYALRDWKDAEIRPRDFTTGVFRAGSTPDDLYLRLRTGLTGTPMPAIPGSADDIWAQVHYIMSLRDPTAATPWVPSGCGGLDPEEVR